MSYTNAEIGNQLEIELSKGWDVVRISRWAYEFYFNNLRELSAIQKDIFQKLFRMEDDPQFEYTEDELKSIADKLIKNEEGSLSQLMNLKKIYN